jgi:hypothetical protein
MSDPVLAIPTEAEWDREDEACRLLLAIPPARLTDRKRRLLSVHCYVTDANFLMRCRFDAGLMKGAVRVGTHAEAGAPRHNYVDLNDRGVSEELGYLMADTSDAVALALAVTHQGNPRAQADLIREMWAWPGRPPFIPPSWMTPEVTSLARQAVATWDPDVGHWAGVTTRYLGILADALQDAGCDDARILTHLRSRTWHLRGCWLLDLLNDKE